MANDYFNKTGNPANHSSGSSTLIRSEFASIETAFDKLPTLTGNGDEVVVVNAGATALVSKTITDLVAGNAALSATETTSGVAEVATQAETDAGADDTRIVTPKKLRNGFLSSIGSSGYIAFPSWLGGWVLQWGGATAAATGRATGAWPLTFPTALYVVVAVGSTGASSTGVHAATRGSAATTSNYDFWLSAAVAHGINYIAIGK
jgi:hypothetical protein